MRCASAQVSISQQIWCDSNVVGGRKEVGSAARAKEQWYCVQGGGVEGRQSGDDSEAFCRGACIGSAVDISVPTSACWWVLVAGDECSGTHMHVDGWRCEQVADVHGARRPPTKRL